MTESNKLNKAQQKLKDRIERAKEIYEKFYTKYRNKEEGFHWIDDVNRHTCAEIQLEFYVSERKAREYLKLARFLHKRAKTKKNT